MVVNLTVAPFNFTDEIAVTKLVDNANTQSNVSTCTHHYMHVYKQIVHNTDILVTVTFTVTSDPPSLDGALVQVYSPASVKMTDLIVKTLPLVPPYMINNRLMIDRHCHQYCTNRNTWFDCIR